MPHPPNGCVLAFETRGLEAHRNPRSLSLRTHLELESRRPPRLRYLGYPRRFRKTNPEQRKSHAQARLLLPVSPQDRIEAEQDPLDPLSLFVARFEILDTDGESIPNHQLELQNNPIQTSNPASLEAIANLALAWYPENEIERRIQDHALRMLLLVIADAAHPIFDDRIAKASTLIDSDLGRKWTLEELGESSGLSPSQFSRLFSKQYGEPPIRSLINRRMKEAKRLVLETSLSLQEISTKLGYENQSFFERQFLKRVGFAPEALRRSRAILRKFHLRI